MKQVCIAVTCSRVVCDAGSSIPATGNGVDAEGTGTPTPPGVAFLLDESACLCSLCANSTHRTTLISYICNVSTLHYSCRKRAWLPESASNALKQGLLQNQLQSFHAAQICHPSLRPLLPLSHRPTPQSQLIALRLCQPLRLLSMLLRPHQLPLLCRLPMSALQQRPRACTQVQSSCRLCMHILHQNII